MEDPTQAFVFFRWVHTLALYIVRAASATKLQHISIEDNFGCAYFGPLQQQWRKSNQPQTQVIREQLELQCLRSHQAQVIATMLQELPNAG